ncbi:3-phosphoshikimate 1-carboxyvinyltransferase [Commensalibacter sp. Nvir]|uniref:3-phosphoshikimate 1-carboxyvinyltransferase n=1 Tax=Commensalibacter sp. Nvir TaxID=3069817 RepID=UPI002D257C7D|nr:3-phosphoshikimate 1-carboxyvinyltransferase [Commensalibacter sp. Nvir]
MVNASLLKPLTVSFNPSALKGEISVPGDKSISHRSLMFSALAKGRCRVSGLLEGEDVLRTTVAMRKLGAKIERLSEGIWLVEGKGIGKLSEPDDVLDLGNSGTSARLLSGILSSHPMFSVLTGDESLRSRPMSRVIVPLSTNGSQFFSREKGRLPLSIVGSVQTKPITYRLPVASAQVKSAILLSALNAHGVTHVIEPIPTRDHTENMLRYFGCEVTIKSLAEGGKRIEICGPIELEAHDIVVPGDPSSAAFILVAAAICKGSEVYIRHVGLNPLRTGSFKVLRAMGANLRILNERHEGGEIVGDLLIQGSDLHGVEVNASLAPSMIDEYPILAVAAAYASGTTRFNGLKELRVKESDRFTSIVAMLKANKVEVETDGDDMIIYGNAGYVKGGGVVETHMDHRLAMSASILGLIAKEKITLDDVSFVKTSFPNFYTLLNQLGAGFEL